MKKILYVFLTATFVTANFNSAECSCREVDEMTVYSPTSAVSSSTTTSSLPVYFVPVLKIEPLTSGNTTMPNLVSSFDEFFYSGEDFDKKTTCMARLDAGKLNRYEEKLSPHTLYAYTAQLKALVIELERVVRNPQPTGSLMPKCKFVLAKEDLSEIELKELLLSKLIERKRFSISLMRYLTFSLLNRLAQIDYIANSDMLSPESIKEKNQLLEQLIKLVSFWNRDISFPEEFERVENRLKKELEKDLPPSEKNQVAVATSAESSATPSVKMLRELLKTRRELEEQITVSAMMALQSGMKRTRSSRLDSIEKQIFDVRYYLLTQLISEDIKNRLPSSLTEEQKNLLNDVSEDELLDPSSEINDTIMSTCEQLPPMLSIRVIDLNKDIIMTQLSLRATQIFNSKRELLNGISPVEAKLLLAQSREHPADWRRSAEGIRDVLKQMEGGTHITELLHPQEPNTKQTSVRDNLDQIERVPHTTELPIPQEPDTKRKRGC